MPHGEPAGSAVKNGETKKKRRKGKTVRESGGLCCKKAGELTSCLPPDLGTSVALVLGGSVSTIATIKDVSALLH